MPIGCIRGAGYGGIRGLFAVGEFNGFPGSLAQRETSVAGNIVGQGNSRLHAVVESA